MCKPMVSAAPDGASEPWVQPKFVLSPGRDDTTGHAYQPLECKIALSPSP